MLESFHGQKREVCAGIAELATLGTRVGAKSLAARIDTDLVQKLHADRFHLVVVGEFNHGKTTFVNALLGEIVLPTGVTPTTAVIHHLEFADTPTAAVVTHDGARHEMAFEDVRSYVVGGDRGGALDAAAVKHLEVGYPSPLLAERVVLVDTPGVNDLSLQRADITYSYIPKSDAVLFLLDAGQPLKESERVFLQEKLLGKSRDKITFVVTKRDIWEPEEETEALAYIARELSRFVPNAPLFPVAAERWLKDTEARKESGQTPSADEPTGMQALFEHLTDFLARERGRILLDNALGEAVEAGRLLGRGIEARRRAAQMPTDELTRRIDALEKDLEGQTKTIEERRSAIREEVAAIRAWVRRDLEHFAEDVVKQLPQMLDRASAEEIRTHLGPFLERTIVEFAEKESKEVAGALETLAERTVALVRDDAHDAAKRLGEALGTDVKAPKVEVDTLRYDIGVVALATVGFGMFFTNVLLGGLLTAAAPLLAMYVKGRVERETRDKAREMAPGVVREAASRLGPKLEEMIEDFAKRLDAWVVTAGEELHREVIEVLSAARAERSVGVHEAQKAMATCDDQTKELERIHGRLDELRKELWQEEPAKLAEAAETPASDGSEAGQTDKTPDEAAPRGESAVEGAPAEPKENGDATAEQDPPASGGGPQNGAPN